MRNSCSASHSLAGADRSSVSPAEDTLATVYRSSSDQIPAESCSSESDTLLPGGHSTQPVRDVAEDRFETDIGLISAAIRGLDIARLRAKTRRFQEKKGEFNDGANGTASDNPGAAASNAGTFGAPIPAGDSPGRIVAGFEIHSPDYNHIAEKTALEFDTSGGEKRDRLCPRFQQDAAEPSEFGSSLRSAHREEVLRGFESLIATLQQRLEASRKASHFDWLTGLGNRRGARGQLQRISERSAPVCVLLFRIEGLREINRANGATCGDRLLQNFARTLSANFPGRESLFRWGPHEFLVISDGGAAAHLENCHSICRRFVDNSHCGADSAGTHVSAKVASGVVEYRCGDTADNLYRRAHENLEQSRGV
jgi:diguanylate cyclase (GGDEF)-like protein